MSLSYFHLNFSFSILSEAVKNLVGDQNAKRGAIKAFEALQDVRLNKQILYVSNLVFLSYTVQA